MTFDTTWQYIRSHLTPGTEVPNWTVIGNTRTGAFTVVSITDKAVEVSVKTAELRQRVPKADFEKVYKVWGQYVLEKVPRSELTAMTRFSKYIISIFHWVDSATLNTG